MSDKISVFWFRRDLRLEDNAGLFHALSSEWNVLPIFIFDTNILNQLENPKDQRVDYIHQALTQLNDNLNKYSSTLKIFYGNPIDIFSELLQTYTIQAVYCNRDYEPEAI